MARKFTPSLVTSFAIALAGVVVCAQLGSGQSRVNLSFVDVLDLSAREGVACGLFFSSMGEASAVVMDYRTGRQLVKREHLLASGSAMNCSFVASLTPDRVAADIYDFGTGSERRVVAGNERRIVAGPRLVGDALWLIEGSGSHGRVTRQDLTTGSRVESLDAVIPADVEFLATSNTAALRAPFAEEVMIWSTGKTWQSVRIPRDLALLALNDSNLLAVSRTSEDLYQRAWPSAEPGDWQPLHRPGVLSGSVPEKVQVDGNEFITLEIHSDSWAILRISETGGVSRWPLPGASQPLQWAWDGGVLYFVDRTEGRMWLNSRTVTQAPESASRLHIPVSHDRGELPSMALADTDSNPDGVALRWLKRQLTEPFQTREGRRGRLIDSFENSARAGWVYDASVAVIALLAWPEDELATDLLNGLSHLQQPDGSWLFAYDPDLARPLVSQRYVGTMAWAVMAANAYEIKTGDRQFARMARLGLDYILRFRATDLAAQTHGGISMGPAGPGRFSLEHNANAYSAFFWRAKLERDATYAEVASGIREFVFRELWAERTQGPEARFFFVGYRDTGRYLDAQTWTSLTFGRSDARAPQLLAALSWAETHLKVEGAYTSSVSGIAGFNEAEGPLIGSKVWSEGSEGMVAALTEFGLTERAAVYHGQSARYLTASGGLPYATTNGDGWSTDASVAGTAWFLLNSGPRRYNPFRPAESW